MADEIKNPDNKKKPSESSDKGKKKTTYANVTKLFWIALAILICLLILSIVVLSARMYKYVTISEDESTIKVSSDSVKNFELFSAEYKNGKGEVTVKSLDGAAVIAPGTSSDYMFHVQNEDDVAIDYHFTPVVKYTGSEKLPIEVKLISPDDKYLVGGPNDTWGTFDDFKNLELSGTLDKGEIDSYEFQWRWLYERGDDAGDTALGNSSEAIGLSVGMDLHSEANLSLGGDDLFFKTTFNDLLWWIIFFVLLLIAIILLVLSLITRKKAEKQPEPVVIYAPAPAPAPVPEPIVVPVKAAPARKKAKGFVGKMEYVNIDTLVDIFNNGDTITLKILKEKRLIDPEATQVKILARNDMVLTKAFHIETQGISAQAKQKVIAAGGSVKIIDG